MEPIFKPKLFSLLHQGISRDQIGKDILSGIVVGIVALPLAIAFAVASGVSPEKGLITAVTAGFIMALLGGSRVQIGGPTGALFVVILGITREFGFNGLMISTIMAGIILIIFGILRLGILLEYIPHPLITGFTSGIAVVIFSTQIKDALGLPLEEVPSAFAEKWMVYLSHAGETNPYTLGLTLVTILIVILTPRFTKRIPGSFIAILLGTAAVYFLPLPVNTIETFLGDINPRIQLALPTLAGVNLTQFIRPALTIALLAGIESLLSAVVADGMIGGHHRSNTELIGLGIANIASTLTGGIPATGAIARTATNVKNGGRTPLAGMVHAVTLLLIMLFCGDLAKLIPLPVLAGILMVVAYNMSEWHSFLEILKSTPFEILVLLSTFFLTIFVDLTVAIQVGIVLSSLLFMYRMTAMGKRGLETDEQLDSDLIEDYSSLPEEVGIYEISGPFFFSAAKHYTETIRNLGIRNRVLILRMRHVPFIDLTGLKHLSQVIEQLHHHHVRVIITGVRPSVLKALETQGILESLGEKNLFPVFAEALKECRVPESLSNF